MPPVLQLFSDTDNKVRFHACEAMYNIAKVTRSLILTYFNEIFDGLCKVSLFVHSSNKLQLCADSDNTVKNATLLLDRLMKDIVTEDENFDVEKFIPLIRTRITTNNPYVRQFLLGWIMVLDSVPDIDMLIYLPQFMDGLFRMLSDLNKEIIHSASTVLEGTFSFLVLTLRILKRNRKYGRHSRVWTTRTHHYRALSIHR